MNWKRLLPFCIVGILCCVVACGDPDNLTSGRIEPPASAFRDGKPYSDIKSLNVVEPRTAIYELPFVVTNSGSFYLANSLNGEGGHSGITVAAHNVRLDLNGFSIWGTNKAHHGVRILDDIRNTSIRNGVIGEWPGWGLFAPRAVHTEVSHVKFYQNGLGGMTAGFGATLERCNVGECGGPGVVTSESGRLLDCKICDNGGSGIQTGNGSLVRDCVVSGNAGDGVDPSDYCTVDKCLCVDNATNGITAGLGCTIRNNTCSLNGRTGRSGAGIHVKRQANRVENNNLTDNRIGLLLEQGGNRVSHNSIMLNEFGLQDKGNGNLIYGNSAGRSSSGTDYSFTGNSHHGKVLSNPGQGFEGSNPWANFQIE